MQARNAHFNLNRLGVTASTYAANFYGTDYVTSPTLRSAGPAESNPGPGIDSDRLFADWQLQSPRVMELANGSSGTHGSGSNISARPQVTIQIPSDWARLCKEDPAQAKQEQLRVRHEFQQAFAAGLIAAAFERAAELPRYLLYEMEALED